MIDDTTHAYTVSPAGPFEQPVNVARLRLKCEPPWTSQPSRVRVPLAAVKQAQYNAESLTRERTHYLPIARPLGLACTMLAWPT